jgi:hypothetical protein
MKKAIALIFILLTISMPCESGDYRKVKIGIYTDSETELRLNDNLAGLFDNYRGNRPIEFYLTGSRRSFIFEEKLAGVSSITVSGPFGIAYSHLFEPPAPSTGVVLLNLPPGAYKFQSTNSVGQVTEIRARIAEVEPVLLRERSFLSFNNSSKAFDVHIEVDAAASEGIRKLELFHNGEAAATANVKGTELRHAFDVRIPQPYHPADFIIQLSDQRDNYRQIRFRVDPKSAPGHQTGEPKLPTRVSFKSARINAERSKPWRTVPKGKSYVLNFGNGVSVIFADVRKTGEVSLTWTTARPPAGYEDAFGASIILQGWNGLEFGKAWLSIDHAALPLSSDQAGRLKVVRVEDPREGRYLDMPPVKRSKTRRITAELKGFGKYMLAVPEFRSTQVTQSQTKNNGLQEIELLCGESLTLERFDLNSPEGQRLIKTLKERDLLPVSHAYRIRPDNITLEPSGALTMRYADRILAALGVSEDSVALYGLSLDGDASRLPYLTLDKESNTLTARVPHTYPLFAVVGSSKQAENQPPQFYPDGIPPTSKLTLSGPQSGEYISTRTHIVLTAEDARVPDVLTSGLKGIYYVLQSPDIPQDEISISTYVHPFTLDEGVTTFTYMAQDKAENYEFPKTTTLRADGTPPRTTLLVSGKPAVPGKELRLTATDKIQLAAVDPVSNGTNSGIKTVFYSVDKPPSKSLSTSVYSVPISLPKGPHTLYYFSSDKVGNMEPINSITLTVTGR